MAVVRQWNVGLIPGVHRIKFVCGINAKRSSSAKLQLIAHPITSAPMERASHYRSVDQAGPVAPAKFAKRAAA